MRLPPGFVPRYLSKIITPDEYKEVSAALFAAIRANPDLFSQEAELIREVQAAQFSKKTPDSQLLSQMYATRQKADAAMVKLDPKVAPIIAKIEAAAQTDRSIDGPNGSGEPLPPPPYGTPAGK
ncbi:MAG TPA: hypothetical protein VL981_11095 [Candidatus Methylacidiphilales bacterium]|nr:hypothetical protein [Candidatus Methylacidiphilales bacterium]